MGRTGNLSYQPSSTLQVAPLLTIDDSLLVALRGVYEAYIVPLLGTNPPTTSRA
jgi:hypothetical protein